MYTETFDGSLSSENSNPEIIDRSGSSSESGRQIDVITIGENGESIFSDTHIDSTKSISASARRSSPSSSSESSSDDFFGMDALKFTTSDASALESKSGKDYLSSSESSAKSEVDNSPPVPTSTYPVFNLTHTHRGMSPTTSPPIQVMDRSGGYDSSRISSSVFERSTNQLEWSFPSNDSLFSIQIGQNSFSRENALMFGELGLSEELTKSGELNTFNQTPSNVVVEIDTARKGVDIENLQTTETSDGAFKLEQEHSEDQNEMKTLHQAASYKSSKSNASSPSCESATSAHSFVSLKKRSRSFCYCSNCSWVFCYYKWPNYCQTWPSCQCSYCSWAFCRCLNWCHTKSSDNASPILTEIETNSFVKTDISRQQSYKQELEATSNSSASCCNCFQSKQTSEVTSNSSSNWFSCFSCPSCTSCKCC